MIAQSKENARPHNKLAQNSQNTYTHTIDNTNVMTSAGTFLKATAAIIHNPFISDEEKEVFKHLLPMLSRVAAAAALTLMVPTKGVETFRTDLNVANGQEVFEQMITALKLHRARINWALVKVQPTKANAAFTQRYFVTVAGDVEIKDLTMVQKMLDLTTLNYYFSY